NLELLHDLLREVLNGRSYYVIDNRTAVDCNLSRAASLTGNRNTGVVSFGGIEATAVNSFRSRLQPSEVQEVAAVKRQVLNLKCPDNARHCVVGSIDLCFTAAGNRYRLGAAADFKLHIERRGAPYFNLDAGRELRLEARGSNLHLIDAWHESGYFIVTVVTCVNRSRGIGGDVA